MLAVHRYAAGSDAVVGATTASTTLIDVDATNAAITFTAPASGNVLVKVSGLQSAGAAMVKWGLRESTTILAGANIGICDANRRRQPAEFYLTGVTAGSHTYKWAHAVASTNTGVYSGPDTGHGAIIMEVWEAP